MPDFVASNVPDNSLAVLDAQISAGTLTTKF